MQSLICPSIYDAFEKQGASHDQATITIGIRDGCKVDSRPFETEFAGIHREERG